jgi:hypothetical protein
MTHPGLARTTHGEGRFAYPYAYDSGASYTRRTVLRSTPQTAPLNYTEAGPVFKGMDPSDPLTHVRAWNPQPGMVAQLNYDGSQTQARTPTQIQRGSQTRPLGIRIAGR